MNTKILKLLEKDARISVSDIAAALGISSAEVEGRIGEMEEQGIIRGYRCVVDGEKLGEDTVSAIIELKVVPKAELGFEDVAEKISHFPEVESVYLMSGACDLIVVVRGKTFRQVSDFVAKELATIENVTSTATQFIMRRYKDYGTELFGTDDDERSRVSL
ncbi:MAG: Lrp/AsnC family transcriptional regulator [Clostridia bacterium]|nr:Lrp/AsnC family transcriptional regulator [Clostridia bacterium]